MISYVSLRDKLRNLARIFHTLSALAASMSLTPCFSWCGSVACGKNGFNGCHPVETVETVLRRTTPLSPSLKQGVNERDLNRRASSCEISSLVTFDLQSPGRISMPVLACQRAECHSAIQQIANLGYELSDAQTNSLREALLNSSCSQTCNQLQPIACRESSKPKNNSMRF